MHIDQGRLSPGRRIAIVESRVEFHLECIHLPCNLGRTHSKAIFLRIQKIPFIRRAAGITAAPVVVHLVIPGTVALADKVRQLRLSPAIHATDIQNRIRTHQGIDLTEAFRSAEAKGVFDRCRQAPFLVFADIAFPVQFLDGPLVRAIALFVKIVHGRFFPGIVANIQDVIVVITLSPFGTRAIGIHDIHPLAVLATEIASFARHENIAEPVGRRIAIRQKFLVLHKIRELHATDRIIALRTDLSKKRTRLVLDTHIAVIARNQVRRKPRIGANDSPLFLDTASTHLRIEPEFRIRKGSRKTDHILVVIFRRQAESLRAHVRSILFQIQLSVEFAQQRIIVITFAIGRMNPVIHVLGHPDIRSELDCLVILAGFGIVQNAPDDCRGAHSRIEAASDRGRIQIVIDIEIVNRRTGEIDFVATCRAAVSAASKQEEGKT